MAKAQAQEVTALLRRIETQLAALYGSAYSDVIRLQTVRKAMERAEASGKVFTFSGNTAAAKAVDSAVKALSAKTNVLLRSTMDKAWEKGLKSDEKVLFAAFSQGSAVNRRNVETITVNAAADLRKRGVDARSFYESKRGGMTVSDRVWTCSGQARQDIENIIQQGMMKGLDAATIAKRVQPYLREPDRLYRRVRNRQTGELELSRAAQTYHPGTGVYRSAYRNALRLVRTEVNAAYRRAEWESFQKNPLIRGFRIVLSNHHTTLRNGKEVKNFRDICDELQGEYPKTFQWTGWHPQCRCHMEPILIDRADFKSHVKAMIKGEDWMPANTVTDVPQAFKDWVADNRSRWEKPGAVAPLFIQDNYSKASSGEKLKPAIAELKKKLDAIQEEERSVEEQIKDVSRYKFIGGKDLYDKLADAVSENDIDEEKAILSKIRAFIDDVTGAWKKRQTDLAAKIQEAKDKGLTDLAAMYQSILDDNSLEKAMTDFLKAHPNPQKAQANDLNIQSYKLSKAVIILTQELEKANGTISQKEYLKQVSEKLGVKQGKARNFGEGMGKANPRYSDPALKSQHKAYSNNCQVCVVAEELRRRGWPVIAKGFTDGGITDEIADMTQKAWTDPKTGLTPHPGEAGGLMNDGKAVPFKKRLSQFQALTVKAGRYDISWSWKGKNYGHIITCERFSDGSMRYYDPQIGKEIPEEKMIEVFKTRIKPGKGIKVLKVDGLRVNLDYLTGMVEKEPEVKDKAE